jgi:hypothetical protein
MKLIEHLRALLADVNLRIALIKEELVEIRDKYGDERRSQIEYSGGDVSIEDLIADENVVITISHAGYIKRTNLSEYKTQNRGGVGQKSAGTRDQDFLEHMFVATNHQYMMFFTQKGKCFWMRVYEIPEGSKTAKGRALQNLINIESDDKVKAFICTQDLKDKEYVTSHNLVMVTKQGQVKKTSLEKYSKPRVNGVAAITIKEGDELLAAQLTNGESQIILAVKSGKLVRFEETKTRPMGRTASGVRGITLKDDKDEVIGMVTVNDMSSEILVVAENGYGKRSSLDEYRITNRGGKGVKTLNITEKTGQLISINAVTDADDLMIENRLQSQLNFMEDNKNVSVLGSQVEYINEFNRTIGISNYPTSYRSIRQELPWNCCLAHPSVMLRTEALLKFGGYSNKYIHAEDYELWLRMFQSTEIRNLTEVLTRYRISSTQVSRINRLEQIYSTSLIQKSFHLITNNNTEFFNNRKKVSKFGNNLVLSKIHFGSLSLKIDLRTRYLISKSKNQLFASLVYGVLLGLIHPLIAWFKIQRKFSSFGKWDKLYARTKSNF